MRPRIFLLPGYGANERSFRHISPYLSDFELVQVDYRPTLHKMSVLGFSGMRLAKRLILEYGIKPFDNLIGHSMGGYLSYNIREVQGNEICMIGAFSDPARVIHFFNFPHLTPLLAGSGFSKTPLAKKYLQSKVAGQPYESELMEIAENFKTFRSQDLYKMTLMTLEKKRQSSFPNPLRIHSSADKVVRPPDEPFIEVEGGHFCLNLYPEKVTEAIRSFLKSEI